MAIAKVQSVTGNGATLVLNSVVAGNALIYISSYYRLTSTGVAEATPTDSNGTFLASSADAPAVISGQDTGASIFHEQNAAAGTHTVTPQANTTHKCSLTEFSGLLTSGMFDVAKSANSVVGNQTSQVTGTTLATAQADELEIISLVIVQGAGGNPIGLTDPVAGTTTLKIDQNTSTDVGGQQAFKVLVSAGTKSETFNWATVDSTTGSFACIATFKAAASTSQDNTQLPTLGRGGRGPTQGPSMRRMSPQQFPVPGPVDTATPVPTATPFRIGRAGTTGMPTRRMIPQQAPDTIPFVQDGSAKQTPFRIGRGGGIGAPTRRMFQQLYPDTVATAAAPITGKIGAYNWAGAAAPLSIIVAATVGIYTWSGKSSPLSTEILGKVGAYTWIGKQASLATEIRSTVGAYTWAGKTATLAASLVSRVGAYTWTGVKSAVPKQITEAVGTYTWAGRSATFGSTVTFSSTVGAYAWSGITSPVLRFVSSTTGAYNWLGSAAVVVSGAAPVAVERFSGGWEYARRARKRLEEELRTEREQWGILPKAAQIVSAVAIRQADALDLDPEQRLEELERELELAGVRYQAQYLELLNLQRQRLIDAEISGYFEAEEALGEENKRRLMLLLAFLS